MPWKKSIKPTITFYFLTVYLTEAPSAKGKHSNRFNVYFHLINKKIESQKRLRILQLPASLYKKFISYKNMIK